MSKFLLLLDMPILFNSLVEEPTLTSYVLSYYVFIVLFNYKDNLIKCISI